MYTGIKLLVGLGSKRRLATFKKYKIHPIKMGATSETNKQNQIILRLRDSFFNCVSQAY